MRLSLGAFVAALQSDAQAHSEDGPPPGDALMVHPPGYPGPEDGGLLWFKMLLSGSHGRQLHPNEALQSEDGPRPSEVEDLLHNWASERDQTQPCAKGAGRSFRYRNAWCEDSEQTDPTSLDSIPVGHGVCIDGHCYDAAYLWKWLARSETVPLSRRPLSPVELEDVMEGPASPVLEAVRKEAAAQRAEAIPVLYWQDAVGWS